MFSPEAFVGHDFETLESDTDLASYACACACTGAGSGSGGGDGGEEQL